MKMQLTRRGFFLGAASAAVMPSFAAGGSPDANLTAILSDMHMSGAGIRGIWGAQPTYQNALFAKAVDRVLALRPLPKRAILLGDVALWFGHRADYEAVRPQVERLRAAGLDVHVTAGNHDHRDLMAEFFPKDFAASPVRGRFAAKIDLGSSDLFLLDTLDENPTGTGQRNATPGALDGGQLQWLAAEAKAARRPFLVASHHPPEELKPGGVPILEFLGGLPAFAGYVHGHNHRWQSRWAEAGGRICRIVGVPTTGWWGDVGFATLRTSADRAVVTNLQDDFFYPEPPKPGDVRPPEWDEIVADNRNARCIFRYGVAEKRPM